MIVLKDYGLVYLATPYSNYYGGLELAFRDASTLAARLLEGGVKVFSPIAHTHPIAMYRHIDPYNHSIWLPFDEAIMSKADALVVALMHNWQNSVGIAHEIEFFAQNNKPVHYLDPESMELVR